MIVMITFDILIESSKTKKKFHNSDLKNKDENENSIQTYIGSLGLVTVIVQFHL